MDDARIYYPVEPRKHDSTPVNPDYSHYNNPIDHTPGRPAGYSRDAGGASAQVQMAAMDELIASSERAGLSPHETAYILAIARLESGFNPDAAAKTTSAYGLGQFTNDTAKDYKVSAANGDLRRQADLLVTLYQDSAAKARAYGQGEDHIYKYYHDGLFSHKDFTSIAAAQGQKDIFRYIHHYEQFVHEHQQVFGITPLGDSMVHSPYHAPPTHHPLDGVVTRYPAKALNT
jgi:putative chitinase